MPARVTVALATTPLAMVVAFMPDAIHVTDAAPGLQLMVFPAVVKTGPAAKLMEVTSRDGNVIVHCTAATAVEDAKDRSNDTDPPWTVEPEAKLREGV